MLLLSYLCDATLALCVEVLKNHGQNLRKEVANSAASVGLNDMGPTGAYGTFGVVRNGWQPIVSSLEGQLALPRVVRNRLQARVRFEVDASPSIGPQVGGRLLRLTTI